MLRVYFVLTHTVALTRYGPIYSNYCNQKANDP